MSPKNRHNVVLSYLVRHIFRILWMVGVAIADASGIMKARETKEIWDYRRPETQTLRRTFNSLCPCILLCLSPFFKYFCLGE